MRKVFTRVATAALLSVAALVAKAQEVAYQLVIPDDPVTNHIELTKNEDGSYTIHFVGNDPFIQLAALTRDLTDEETYLTYEYQLDQKINSDMEIFFSPIAGGRSLNYGACLPTTGDEWKEMNIDISAKRTEYNWGHKGDYLRFDMGWGSDKTLTVRNLRIRKLPIDTNEVYQIGTAEQLNEFMNLVNGGLQSMSACLTADIDFSNYSNRFLYMKGNLDGQGHTITINYNMTDGNAALIEHLYGKVSNLKVSGNIVTSSVNAAGIAAHINNGTISNCVCDVNITSTYEGSATDGGIVAEVTNPSLIENTIFCGQLNGETTTASGGIIGWASSRITIKNCLYIGESTMGEDNSDTFGRNHGNVNVINSYYLKSFGGVPESATQLSGSEAVSNGEACYLLNGDQQDIQWYQTLGKDATPVPFAYGDHAKVFASGDLRCDGSLLEGGNVTFSNTGGTVTPSHDFIDGICSVCGQINTEYATLDEEGYYLIDNSKKLMWVSVMVEHGYNDINVRITSDLDLSGVELRPIGNNAIPFRGTFDGGNHVIRGLEIQQVEQNGVGLFGYIDSPAIIKNITLDNTCSLLGNRFVGIVGSVVGDLSGEVTMSGIGYEGSIEAAGATAAGILGCGGGSGRVNIINCYTTGNITAQGEAAAFAAWTTSNTYLENCWTTAEVTGIEGEYAYCFRGNAHATNCYSIYGAQGTILTEDAIASGELCYALNGEQLASAIWYQTLDMDKHPVLDRTHGLVYKVNEDYACIYDENSFLEYRDRIIESDKNQMSEIIATQAYVESYLAQIDKLATSTDRDEFISSYYAISELRDSITASAEAYARYKGRMEEIISQLAQDDSFVGATRNLLEKYLQEKEGASEDYPNGTYLYIYENHVLTTEQITEETAFVEALLLKAISEGYTKDSDITSLLKNANFTEGFDGWEGVMPNNLQDGVVETYNDPFDMHQTLTGLANGVYELQVTGLFRPTGDAESTNYAAMIYANDLKTYLPAEIENDANPSVILANITDGTLTIGIKNEGTGCSGDYTKFSNIKLYYRGALEDATESMDNTLEGCINRASTILSYEYWDDGDFAKRPNFSQALRVNLQEACNQVSEAKDANSKYLLLTEFSDLFQEVYVTKQAYVALVSEMIAINEAYQGDFEGADDVFNLYLNTWASYVDGTYTAEEAQAETERMRKAWPRDYITLNPGNYVNNMEIVVSAPFTYDITVTGEDPFVAVSPLTEDLPEDKTIMMFEYKTDFKIRGEFFFFSPVQNWREEWLPTLEPAAEWTKAGFDFADFRDIHSWGAAGSYLRWDPVQDGLVSLSIRHIKFVTPEEFNGTDNPDGITLTPMMPKNTDGLIYNLSGQRLSKMQKGINIINGKKILLNK